MQPELATLLLAAGCVDGPASHNLDRLGIVRAGHGALGRRHDAVIGGHEIPTGLDGPGRHTNDALSPPMSQGRWEITMKSARSRSTLAAIGCLVLRSRKKSAIGSRQDRARRGAGIATARQEATVSPLSGGVFYKKPDSIRFLFYDLRTHAVIDILVPCAGEPCRNARTTMVVGR